MTQKLREQISALADDELPAGELELLARRFSLDKYLNVSWERYHLIGEAMRRALPQVDTRGFADRIIKALDADAVQIRKHNRSVNGYFRKTAAGVSLAACAAIVAVASLHHGGGAHLQSSSAPSDIGPSMISIQTSPVSYGTSNNPSWNGNTPEVQAELSNYLINHNEIATAIVQQGMSPYLYISPVRKGQTAKLTRISQQLQPQDRR